MLFKSLILAAAAASVNAQRPSDTPICDYYTTALLKNNTAANQYALLTVLVNTVVIGNFSVPGLNNSGIMVPGILAPGKVNGTDVNLLPYFNGDLESSNDGGSSGVSMNFLDGGGADPLTKVKPANDETSNQYFLLTHLYEFFGSLLGCSMQGMSGFDAYAGDKSMYEVHKFMDLNYAQVTYFITQVALAAQHFGVATDDITIVGKALNSLFNVKCAPATAVIPAQGPQLQSICTDGQTCPLAANATCSLYETPVAPMTNKTMASGSASGTSSPTGTSKPTTVPANGAATTGLSLMAVALGVVAFAL